MSTFSSVVRKPGLKITPRVAPRRNVQTKPRDVAPPSLAPDSQTVTSETEPVDQRAQSQEAGQAQSVLESTEIPDLSQTVEEALPQPEPIPLETGVRSSARGAANRIPSVSVEVIVPDATTQATLDLQPSTANRSRNRLNTIPTITTSSSSSIPLIRRLAENSTPSRSESSTQALDNADEGPSRSPTDSRKRRKITHPPPGTGELQALVAPSLSSGAASIIRSSSRNRRSESRSSDALLQDATSQAAAVSELANSIENQARSLRPRSSRRSSSQAQEADEPDGEADSTVKARRTRKKPSRANAIEALAQRVVEAAVSGDTGSRRYSRLSTPENAEDIRIDPEEVSMGDLVRDTKVGKKSETEKKMQENWGDIKRRRKEEVERRREAAGQGRHGRQAVLNQDVPVEVVEPHVPQQIIVNGQIVVVAESREVAFGARVEQAVIEDADVALEDDRIYKYVNQGTLGKNAGRRRGIRWDDDQTERFYKGLRMFGTDFGMIANLFPEWNRKQIKLKFIAEERTNPNLVRESVATKEPVNLEEYSKQANQVFEDPAELQAELEAEEKRLRDEDERRRMNEGYILDSADIAWPTTERNGEEAEDVVDQDRSTAPETGARTEAASTDRRDRISALAESVVAAATAPRRKQAQPRKTKEPTARGRQGKKGRRPLEGVEERIGPIDEVDR